MKRRKPKICSICQSEYEGIGNNAEPVIDDGRCCNHCNGAVVIPARLRESAEYANARCVQHDGGTAMNLEHIAYHEAGHAVMAFRLGYEVEKVSIKPMYGSLGRAKISARSQSPDDIRIDLAGALAEALWLDRGDYYRSPPKPTAFSRYQRYQSYQSYQSYQNSKNRKGR